MLNAMDDEKYSDEKAEAFYGFLIEYAQFFDEMEQFEKEKLSVLLSGRLPEIEHVISVAQSNAKRLENLEQKRIKLQMEAGLGAMSMGELASATAGERRNQLGDQLRQLTASLNNIKFYNKKSMEAAELNLRKYAASGTGAQKKPSHSMLEGKA